MSLRYPTKDGLLKWDHSSKTVYQLRQLNPPTYNARFLARLREEYPDYTVVPA